MIPLASMRPTLKELNKKLTKARNLVANGDWAPVDPLKVMPEFHSLNLHTAEGQTRALIASLNEITPAHYDGSRPPAKSYERAARGQELFAFAWESSRFRRSMYLKFCFRGDTLYLVSIHGARF